MGGVISSSFEVVSPQLEPIRKNIYQEESFWTLRKKYPLYGFSCAMTRKFVEELLPMPNISQHDLFIGMYGQWTSQLTLLKSITALHRWFGEGNTSNTALHVPISIRAFNRIKLILYVWQRAVRSWKGRKTKR